MTNNTIPNVPRELLDSLLTVIDSNGYAADEVEVVDELRAILSAPSPAGVDGLKRYEVFPYLDDDVAELDICESDDGTFVKYDDAQAIIDGLRGEADQQAQRIGELASHLEFAVTLLTVAGLAGNAQVEAMRAALSAGNEPKQCT